MTLAQITIKDPTTSQIKTGPRFLQKWIEDPRDVPLLKTVIKLSLICIPVAIYQFIPEYFRFYIAFPYVAANLLLNVGPYTLMLHNVSHRRLFKRKYNFMNKYITWVLGPFYGQTPETYYAHHIGMHHVEGNQPGDLSSTMKYQRDSFLDFMKYFLTFFFFGIFQLSAYHKRKGNTRMMRNAIIGELYWYALIIGLSFINLPATMIFFVMPLVFARFGMMAGNWAQHAFIDQNAPDDDYVSSLTCINSAYNKNCFNDGYHISHHIDPSLHWSMHPLHLKEHHEEYEKHGSIIFEKVDFFLVWLLLMLKQYKVLARRMVSHGELSEFEKIALIKDRLRPFPVSVTGFAAANQ